MQRQPFKLCIHPEDNDALFAALLQVRQANHHRVTVGRRLRRWARYVGEAVQVVSMVDLKAEWERCIKVAEESQPQTIFEFWRVFAAQAKYRFYVDEWGGHGAPKVAEALSFGIHTSLTKSLMLQFAGEPDIHVCAEKLFSSVPNATCVYWDRIDTRAFDARVRESWAAFHRLMVCSKEYYSLHTSLLTSAGLSEKDFITTFFSGHPLPKTNLQHIDPIFSRDILTLIAVYLTPADLHRFRQISHNAYNAVECTTTARLKHRLHVVQHNKLLHQLIGSLHYMNEHYLMTVPEEGGSNGYICRLTSLTPPFTSRTVYGLNSQFDRVIGAHVQQHENGALTLFTACEKSYGNDTMLYRLQMTAFDADYQRGNISALNVKHPFYEYKNRHHHYDPTPIWRRSATFAINANNVTLDIQFNQMVRTESNTYPPNYTDSGVKEYQRAEFGVAEFDVGNGSVETVPYRVGL